MKRILLVEDEAAVLAVTKKALQREYEITVARSVEEAIGFADDGETFDLLITDLVLPGRGGGIRVATHFLEAFPALPVLIISGYVLVEDRIEQALASPRTAFLQKPFELRTLQETVRSLVS